VSRESFKFDVEGDYLTLVPCYKCDRYLGSVEIDFSDGWKCVGLGV